MKRLFDFTMSFVGLIVLCPIIAVAWVAAAISTRSHGLFVQHRVGKHGKRFAVIKLRSMRNFPGASATTVTTRDDCRITPVGSLLRRLKLDELPQLINVLFGQMSLVGPRPDVLGFADQLTGSNRIVLSVLPGITGPASLKFRDEEQMLADASDPEKFNRDVIWPEKVRLNCEYVRNYLFRTDLRYIFQTIFKTERHA
ncbi:MAG: sugar transferase [Fuerstiella sp.]